MASNTKTDYLVDVDWSVPLEEFMEFLQKAVKEHTEKGYRNFYLENNSGYDGDSPEMTLMGDRDMTLVELEQRDKALKLSEERNKEYRRSQYLRLKEEFEGK